VPDSKEWFASNQTQQSADLLYIELDGNTHHLWHLDGYNILLWGRPSPDGHHLAIQGSADNSNMWVTENFLSASVGFSPSVRLVFSPAFDMLLHSVLIGRI
jgi:hypothetical protein